MLTSKKNLFLALISVLIFAFALNTININCIKNQKDKSNEFLNKTLVFNQTIFSIDNNWYLPQIQNFLSGDGFTCDTSNTKLAVRRTPVYPLFYGIHYVLFGEEASFYYIKITQTFLFALSAIALLLAVFLLTNNKKVAWFSFVIYGFNPTLISYTYYTITESLSPALVCFMLYFLSSSVKNNSIKSWFFTGIIFSLAALCRPTIFFFGLSIAFALLYINLKNFKKLVYNSVAFGLALSLVFVPYVIRNYKVTNGDFVLLEKFYNDPMGYGMQNIEFRKWISSWMNPADYNSERVSNKMRDNVLQHRDKKTLIDSLIKTIPTSVYLSYNKETVLDIYHSMYNFYEYQLSINTDRKIDSVEKLTILNIKQHTDNFIEKNTVHYYIVMPILFLKSIIIQSNSASIAYLDNYKSNHFLFFIKLLLILLNVYLFLSLVGNLFYSNKYFLIYIVLFLFVFLNCGYMLFVIKYFEARYLIPLFPLLYISGAIFGVETYNRLKQKLNF